MRATAASTTSAPSASRGSRRASTCGPPSTPSPARLLPLLLPVAVAVVAGCDGSPTSPPGQGVELSFDVAADSLVGLEGETLRNPVTVVATDGAGHRSPGTEIQLRVVEGGGSVESRSAVTDASGEAQVQWTLGSAGEGAQRLEARVSGRGGGSTATLEATALGPDETDVVIVRGAAGPLRGLLVLSEDIEERLFVAQQRMEADTVIPLFPLGSVSRMIAVLPTANRPALVRADWTPGVDTAFVELAPPVELDLRIVIHAGPFEERKKVAEEHLAAARAVWEQESVGVTFGQVEFLDRTGSSGRVELQSVGLCEDVTARSVIRVDYVHSIDDDANFGWGCPPSQAYMGLPSEQTPRLLAHELGHVFNLPHTASGLMKPNDPGGTVTDGQIFRAHFDEESGINVVFDGHLVEARRACSPQVRRLCLPLDFELDR